MPASSMKDREAFAQFGLSGAQSDRLRLGHQKTA